MLKIVGINHHTAAINVREDLAFNSEQVVAALKRGLDAYAQSELVLLSTCNRTELYIGGESESMPNDEELLEFLCREKSLTSDQTTAVYEHRMFFRDRDAIAHLFNVAASLDSMVLGEPQILAQVKNAYQIADDVGTTGPVTHQSFQAALRLAKMVANQTEIFKHRVSIPSVAVVDFAMQIFERLDDKKTLLFGAGEMGEETLQYLKDHGARRLVITNRSRNKAEELAAKWSAEVVDWEQRFAELETADVLISTTGSPEPVLKLDDFRKVEPKRRGKPLFSLDLAVPRDIEPEIGNEPNVYLYSIDDLKQACDKNRAARDRETPKALKIVETETDRFMISLRHRKTGNVIRQLREGWDVRKDDELKRLFNKLPTLDDKSKDEIRYSFDRLVNKLLHPPLESLRDEAHHGSSSLLEALARLFGLQR